MAGDNLGYKPAVVEQAKFEYYPLGKVFNKGLDKEDKKEWFLTTYRHLFIEDINKKQLEKQLKPVENDRNNTSTKTFKKLKFLDKKSTNAKKKNRKNLMKSKE